MVDSMITDREQPLYESHSQELKLSPRNDESLVVRLGFLINDEIAGIANFGQTLCGTRSTAG